MVNYRIVMGGNLINKKLNKKTYAIGQYSPLIILDPFGSHMLDTVVLICTDHPTIFARMVGCMCKQPSLGSKPRQQPNLKPITSSNATCRDDKVTVPPAAQRIREEINITYHYSGKRPREPNILMMREEHCRNPGNRHLSNNGKEKKSPFFIYFPSLNYFILFFLYIFVLYNTVLEHVYD